ncbi:MAG: glycoside hydrolase family 95 protein [Clostridia bacterium]|nr:glycoside hydrolase family 95 protein [Clostridia bacterium]
MEHLLYYKNVAESFEEALPIGNGRLGAMVYGKTDVERVSLNEDSIWSGKRFEIKPEHDAVSAFKEAGNLTVNGEYKAAEALMEKNMNSKETQLYMPLGNLYIDFGHKDITQYKRELDLKTAVVSVSYVSNGIHYRREYFVSDNCIVMRFSADAEFDIAVSFDTLHKLTDEKKEDNTIAFFCECPGDGSISRNPVYTYDEQGTEFVCGVKVLAGSGSVSVDQKTISVRNTDCADILFAVNTTYYNPDRTKLYEKCMNQLTPQKTFEMLKSEAIERNKGQYERASLQLTDEITDCDLVERLSAFDGNDVGLYELMFNYGRYLVIASSQPGTQATNLQGIWNEDWIPAWSCNYTLNINTQMNYWPVLNTNLKECFEPFMTLVEKVHITGKKVAEAYYGARGFVCHHNTDIWGHSNQCGGGAINNSECMCWNMGSGWLAIQIFDYYEYTNDIQVLENKIYPIMCDAALFYIDIMREYNGYYIIAPTTSPENSFIFEGNKCAITRSSAMTTGIVRDLFRKLLKAEKVLGIESELSKKIEEILPKLNELKVGRDGSLMEWEEDFEEFDVCHRHISHLYGLFPGNQISVEKTPELADACRNVLRKKGITGTGWSLSWKACCYTALKDGNMALKHLQRQLKLVPSGKAINYHNNGGTYPNLFDAHPPFQIDGNFGFTACVANMLVQSSDDTIEILPALPDKWKKGSVKGLVAKHNIEVSILWNNGKAYKVELLSPNSIKINIKINSKKLNLDLVAGISTVLAVTD